VPGSTCRTQTTRSPRRRVASTRRFTWSTMAGLETVCHSGRWRKDSWTSTTRSAVFGSPMLSGLEDEVQGDRADDRQQDRHQDHEQAAQWATERPNLHVAYAHEDSIPQAGADTPTGSAAA